MRDSMKEYVRDSMCVREREHVKESMRERV